MKNSDMPAMPQSGTEGASGDLNNSGDWGGSGLTKREHFAGLAMQGLLSRSTQTLSMAQRINRSVEYADLLLRELDK